MSAVAPERTTDQRMRALQHANTIRVQRAALKRALRDGTAQLSAVILDPPDWLGTMHVFDLLCAAPKVGRVKARRLMVACAASERKTVGGLSWRQREALAQAVKT